MQRCAAGFNSGIKGLTGIRLCSVVRWAFREIPPNGRKKPNLIDRPQTAEFPITNTGMCTECTVLCNKWSFREVLLGRRKNLNRLKPLFEALYYKQ
jgi:hypothetical protein